MTDRDAVREAVAAMVADADTLAPHSAKLARLLGLPLATWTPAMVADALLSRAQPERRTETYPHDCGCETCPEHTRPAPVVTEAMVEAHIAARRCENAVKPNGFENGSHADLYCPDCVRLRLTAALAATRGEAR